MLNYCFAAVKLLSSITALRPYCTETTPVAIPARLRITAHLPQASDQAALAGLTSTVAYLSKADAIKLLHSAWLDSILAWLEAKHPAHAEAVRRCTDPAAARDRAERPSVTQICRT